MPCSRIRAVSSDRRYGPRDRITVWCIGIAVCGGSTTRMRNHADVFSAKASTSCLPVVRNTRACRPSRCLAALCMSGTRTQVSPSPGDHDARHSRTRGSARSWVAAAALALMPLAKGCVASTTTRMALSRSHVRRPAAPPKPPMRTAPTGSRGSATRPASELITGMFSATSPAASARASPVPPSTSTTGVSVMSSMYCRRGRRCEVLSSVPASRDNCLWGSRFPGRVPCPRR